MSPRHFSMLREFHLADWFTLGNAFCGTGAIFAAMRFLQDGDVPWLLAGMALIPLAFVFDALDGRVARARHTASTLGRELDSLSDVISFGVAPVPQNALPSVNQSARWNSRSIEKWRGLMARARPRCRRASAPDTG